MMVILALTSIVFILLGSYYVISTKGNVKLPRKSFFDLINHKKSSVSNTARVNDNNFEKESKDNENLEYWLKQLCSINEKINEYYSEDSNTLSDLKSTDDQQTITLCKNMLSALNPTLMSSNINKIISSDNVFCDSHDQIILLIKELIEEINLLLRDPFILPFIKEKLNALTVLEDKVTLLLAERSKLVTKNLNQIQAEEIIEDTMGIIPTVKLAQSQYNNFTNFYFNYKLCHSLIPHFEIQLNQIYTYNEQVLDFLAETDEVLFIEKSSRILGIQSKFLGLYRSYFNYFNYLYLGLETYLNVLKSSSLREIYQSKSSIIELLEVIEDILETCNYFAHNEGTSENEFNNFFNKIRQVGSSRKSKTLLSIGVRESAKVFFETRAKNAESLIKNQQLLKIDQILSRVNRSFQSL